MVLQDLLSYVPYFWRMHRELGEEEQGGRQQMAVSYVSDKIRNGPVQLLLLLRQTAKSFGRNRRDATFLRQCMWRKACTNLSPSVQ